jgi:phytoene desaturase
LIKLSPAYRVYFGVDEFIAIADNSTWNRSYFENIEKGSGAVLHDFDGSTKYYNIAIKDLVYRPVFHLELTVETAKKVGNF